MKKKQQRKSRREKRSAILDLSKPLLRSSGTLSRKGIRRLALSDQFEVAAEFGEALTVAAAPGGTVGTAWASPWRNRLRPGRVSRETAVKLVTEIGTCVEKGKKAEVVRQVESSVRARRRVKRAASSEDTSVALVSRSVSPLAGESSHRANRQVVSVSTEVEEVAWRVVGEREAEQEGQEGGPQIEGAVAGEDFSAAVERSDDQETSYSTAEEEDTMSPPAVDHEKPTPVGQQQKEGTPTRSPPQTVGPKTPHLRAASARRGAGAEAGFVFPAVVDRSARPQGEDTELLNGETPALELGLVPTPRVPAVKAAFAFTGQIEVVAQEAVDEQVNVHRRLLDTRRMQYRLAEATLGKRKHELRILEEDRDQKVHELEDFASSKVHYAEELERRAKKAREEADQAVMARDEGVKQTLETFERAVEALAVSEEEARARRLEEEVKKEEERLKAMEGKRDEFVTDMQQEIVQIMERKFEGLVGGV